MAEDDVGAGCEERGGGSTSNVNDYLKSFTGFDEACDDVGGLSLKLCAWIGARDVTPGAPDNGPYQWIDDPSNNIPCSDGACDPQVQPGVDTTLVLEDWCSWDDGCPDFNWADEPNASTEEYVGYLKWTNSGGIIGWHDSIEANVDVTSYFVNGNCSPPSALTNA